MWFAENWQWVVAIVGSIVAVGLAVLVMRRVRKENQDGQDFWVEMRTGPDPTVRVLSEEETRARIAGRSRPFDWALDGDFDDWLVGDTMSQRRIESMMQHPSTDTDEVSYTFVMDERGQLHKGVVSAPLVVVGTRFDENDLHRRVMTNEARQRSLDEKYGGEPWFERAKKSVLRFPRY